MVAAAWEDDATAGAAAAPDSENRPGVCCADETAGVELNENAAALLVVTGGNEVGAEKLNPVEAGALAACDGPREKPELVAGVDAAEKLKAVVAGALDPPPPPNKDTGAGAFVVVGAAGAAAEAPPKANGVDVGEAAGADEAGVPKAGADDPTKLKADPADGFAAAVGVLKAGPPPGAPNAGAAAAGAEPKAGAGVDEAAPPNAGVDGVPNAGAEEAAPNTGFADAPPNSGADDAAKAEAEGVPKAEADDPKVGAADDEAPKAAAADEPNREPDDDGVEKENGAEEKDMTTTKGVGRCRRLRRKQQCRRARRANVTAFNKPNSSS